VSKKGVSYNALRGSCTRISIVAKGLIWGQFFDHLNLNTSVEHLINFTLSLKKPKYYMFIAITHMTNLQQISRSRFLSHLALTSLDKEFIDISFTTAGAKLMHPKAPNTVLFPAKPSRLLRPRSALCDL